MADAKTVHSIATAATKELVQRALQAGLSPAELLAALESTVAIAVLWAAEATATPDPQRYAQEVIDTLTEAAHSRVRMILDKRDAAHG